MARVPPNTLGFWLAAALVLCASLSARRAAAQTVWELTPYKINLLVADELATGLGSGRAAGLANQVAEHAVNIVGGAWDLSAAVAPEPLATRMTVELASIEFDDLPPEMSDADKVILLTVAEGHLGWRILVREFDMATGVAGLSVIRDVPQAQALAPEAFRAVLEAFSPLARIESVERKKVTMRLRAAALSPRDPSLRWVETGALFRPVARITDRQGNTSSIRPIEWTYLYVESISGSVAECTMYTDLRSALTGRRRGRVELLAVAVRPVGGTTTITFRSRSDPESPLMGYEVYDRGPGTDAPEFLGRTDRDGRLRVGPGPAPLRVLWVTSGNQPLARLPLLPGRRTEIVVDLPDDTPRILALGFITGVQEELVDLVTRREVLIALARARLDEDKLDEAQSLLGELRRLPSGAQLRVLLRQQRPRYQGDDAWVRRQIDKLFSDTESLVNQYLSRRSVEALERELIEARRGASSSD